MGFKDGHFGSFENFGGTRLITAEEPVRVFHRLGVENFTTWKKRRWVEESREGNTFKLSKIIRIKMNGLEISYVNEL